MEAKDDNGRTALCHAAMYRRDIVAKLLLDKGANMKVNDNFGSTPLWYAKTYRSGTVVNLLLARDTTINPDSQNTKPNTAVMHRREAEEFGQKTAQLSTPRSTDRRVFEEKT